MDLWQKKVALIMKIMDVILQAAMLYGIEIQHFLGVSNLDSTPPALKQDLEILLKCLLRKDTQRTNICSPGREMNGFTFKLDLHIRDKILKS